MRKLNVKCSLVITVKKGKRYWVSVDRKKLVTKLEKKRDMKLYDLLLWLDANSISAH